MKEKNILVTLFLSLLFSIGVKAQTTEGNQKKEVGIRMNSLSNFGFMYKKQKKENKFNRVRLVSSNFMLSNSPFQRTAFSLGIAIGRENRKVINNKFKLIKGWEFITSFSSSKINNEVMLDIKPGLGAVLGFIYKINDEFSLNLECIPILKTDFQSTSGNTTFTGVNFDFDTNNVALGVMYSF